MIINRGQWLMLRLILRLASLQTDVPHALKLFQFELLVVIVSIWTALELLVVIVTAVVVQMGNDVVVKNIPTEEVWVWWRVAYAWAWVAKATATQVGYKRLLVSAWGK